METAGEEEKAIFARRKMNHNKKSLLNGVLGI